MTEALPGMTGSGSAVRDGELIRSLAGSSFWNGRIRICGEGLGDCGEMNDHGDGFGGDGGEEGEGEEASESVGDEDEVFQRD